jgi:hypothetical protein
MSFSEIRVRLIDVMSICDINGEGAETARDGARDMTQMDINQIDDPAPWRKGHQPAEAGAMTRTMPTMP